LLLHANEVVSRDRLIDELWGETPPETAPTALQVYVSQLRKTLEPGLGRGGASRVLLTRAPGYLLRVEPEQVDALRFERLVREAKEKRAAGDPAGASVLLDQALSLWRGPALADFAYEAFAQADIARLEELRLTALEDHSELEMAFGRGGELVAELEALVAQNPLRERLRAQLMLALYRAGRQAEALEEYQAARRVLVDELGIDPSPALQSLEKAILLHDPALEPSPEPEAAPPAEPLALSTEPTGSYEPGMRKTITVLAAEAAVSPVDGHPLDPESLGRVLARYTGAASDVLSGYGATVERPLGDSVVGIFGIPILHEDDAMRAVRAALDLRETVAGLNEELPRDWAARIALRIGIDTSEALTGDPAAGDPLVTGEAIGAAFRLGRLVRTGEIVVGERTASAARDAFEFSGIETLSPEDGSEPLSCRRLLRPLSLATARHVAGVATRMIGRQRELSLLETLYRAAVEERRPRLVTILGSAGIGKTRLTAEFIVVAKAGDEPPAVYRGRCLPYGEGITYWALREVLSSAARILLDDPAAVAIEKFEKFVRALLERTATDSSDAERVVFAVAKTAGISLADNPLERMSPESVGEELGLAWPRLLSALAADQPVLLLVEDLHRGEPPLLDILEHLVSRSTGPIFIIATGRPELAELRHAWTTRPAMAQIGLEPLTEAQSVELVDELVPAVGSRLREKVLAAAEGNPFFAEEIVRHLIDQGVLARSDGRIIEADAEAPTVTLPDTVRALLAARVDALRAEEKRTLQDAAVVGRVFWVTTLESMRPEREIRPALRALEDKGLVVTRQASTLPGHTELWFHHGLTREVAYESIPRGRRARAHADVGGWIEQLAGDRRSEYIDLLAYHYEAAAQPEDAELAWPAEASVREELRSDAVTALIEAGHAARTRFAIDQALGFGDRALALATSELERLAGLELKAQAAHAIVRADEAWRYYLEALEIAERIGDKAAIRRLRANATLLWSRYGGALAAEDWKAEAREILERGLEETREGEVTFERGALLAGRATATYWEVAPLGEEVPGDAERAVEIAKEIGSSALLTYALDALAFHVQQKGFCESTQVAKQALEVGKSMEDRVEAHEMFVTAAISFAEVGDFEAAATTAAEAARLAVQLGPHRGLHAGSAQTKALLHAGRLPELLDATDRAAELIAEEGMQTCFHGLIALAGQALAAHELKGRAAGARVLEVYDATKPLTATFNQLHALEILRPLLGVEETRRRFESVNVPDTLHARIYQQRTALQVFALVGEWTKFERLADDARALAQTACAPALAWIADWGEAVRLATTGRSEGARAKAAAATASLESFGERYTAARLLADFLQFFDSDAELVEDTAQRLEALGAFTTAAEVRAER
jgi:DNA-binding SARP family transcriptional activator